VGLKGFWLFSSNVASVIKGIYVFLSSNRKYIRVFKLLAYLGIRAYSAVLPRGLYYYNLLLSEGPSYLGTTAFHKVFIEFLLSHYEILKEE